MKKVYHLSTGREIVVYLGYPGLQLLRGLTSVVNGLSGLSNKMGDRHVRSHRPAKHHAALCVNAAKTLCDFMVSSYIHQLGKKPATKDG